MLGLKLNHVSKRGYWWHIYTNRRLCRSKFHAGKTMRSWCIQHFYLALIQTFTSHLHEYILQTRDSCHKTKLCNYFVMRCNLRYMIRNRWNRKYQSHKQPKKYIRQFYWVIKIKCQFDENIAHPTAAFRSCADSNEKLLCLGRIVRKRSN